MFLSFASTLRVGVPTIPNILAARTVRIRNCAMGAQRTYLIGPVEVSGDRTALITIYPSKRGYDEQEDY